MFYPPLKGLDKKKDQKDPTSARYNQTKSKGILDTALEILKCDINDYKGSAKMVEKSSQNTNAIINGTWVISL